MSSGTDEFQDIEDKYINRVETGDTSFDVDIAQVRHHITQDALDRRLLREGREKKYGLRDGWSSIIKIILIATITLQTVLFFLVGLGFLDFSQHPNYLVVIAGQLLVQTAGLVWVIVNHLFSD